MRVRIGRPIQVRLPVEGALPSNPPGNRHRSRDSGGCAPQSEQFVVSRLRPSGNPAEKRLQSSYAIGIVENQLAPLPDQLREISPPVRLLAQPNGQEHLVVDVGSDRVRNADLGQQAATLPRAHQLARKGQNRQTTGQGIADGHAP